jgi:hypothetical protein
MFSELVDRAVHISGRPDAITDIAYFANETMRNVSKRSDWREDSVEELVNVPSDGILKWVPEVGRSRFRREEYLEDGCGCRPKFVLPNSQLNKFPSCVYYVSGGDFIFQRLCSPLKIFYFAYQPWLEYYPLNARPAVFDVKTNSWAATAANIALVSNWMLERQNSLILDGTLASFFAVKQDPRQQVHYSKFEQGINHLVSAESHRELLTRR